MHSGGWAFEDGIVLFARLSWHIPVAPRVPFLCATSQFSFVTHQRATVVGATLGHCLHPDIWDQTQQLRRFLARILGPGVICDVHGHRAVQHRKASFQVFILDDIGDVFGDIADGGRECLDIVVVRYRQRPLKFRYRRAMRLLARSPISRHRIWVRLIGRTFLPASSRLRRRPACFPATARAIATLRDPIAEPRRTPRAMHCGRPGSGYLMPKATSFFWNSAAR